MFLAGLHLPVCVFFNVLLFVVSPTICLLFFHVLSFLPPTCRRPSSNSRGGCK